METSDLWDPYPNRAPDYLTFCMIRGTTVYAPWSPSPGLFDLAQPFPFLIRGFDEHLGVAILTCDKQAEALDSVYEYRMVFIRLEDCVKYIKDRNDENCYDPEFKRAVLYRNEYAGGFKGTGKSKNVTFVVHPAIESYLKVNSRPDYDPTRKTPPHFSPSAYLNPPRRKTSPKEDHVRVKRCIIQNTPNTSLPVCEDSANFSAPGDDVFSEETDLAVETTRQPTTKSALDDLQLVPKKDDARRTNAKPPPTPSTSFGTSRFHRNKNYVGSSFTKSRERVKSTSSNGSSDQDSDLEVNVESQITSSVAIPVPLTARGDTVASLGGRSKKSIAKSSSSKGNKRAKLTKSKKVIAAVPNDSDDQDEETMALELKRSKIEKADHILQYKVKALKKVEDIELCLQDTVKNSLVQKSELAMEIFSQAQFVVAFFVTANVFKKENYHMDLMLFYEKFTKLCLEPNLNIFPTLNVYTRANKRHDQCTFCKKHFSRRDLVNHIYDWYLVTSTFVYCPADECEHVEHTNEAMRIHYCANHPLPIPAEPVPTQMDHTMQLLSTTLRKRCTALRAVTRETLHPVTLEGRRNAEAKRKYNQDAVKRAKLKLLKASCKRKHSKSEEHQELKGTMMYGSKTPESPRL